MLHTREDEGIKSESFVKDLIEAAESDPYPIHRHNERNGRINGLF